MEAREARGEDPDAVTGASRVNYRSPKEANPQVRLACNDVPSSKLADAERPPVARAPAAGVRQPSPPAAARVVRAHVPADASGTALADSRRHAGPA